MEARKAFVVRELPEEDLPKYVPDPIPIPLCRCACHILGDGVVSHFVSCCRYTYKQYLIPKDPLYFCGFHSHNEEDSWVSLNLLEEAERQVQEFEQKNPQ
jgi:hypothetical protein